MKINRLASTLKFQSETPEIKTDQLNGANRTNRPFGNDVHRIVPMLVIFAGQKCDLNGIPQILKITVSQYCEIRKPSHCKIYDGSPKKRPEMNRVYEIRPAYLRQNFQFDETIHQHIIQWPSFLDGWFPVFKMPLQTIYCTPNLVCNSGSSSACRHFLNHK